MGQPIAAGPGESPAVLGGVGRRLALHLALGLAISLAGLWVFGSVAEGVADQEPLTRLDATLLEWFRAHATPTGYAVASGISRLGAPVTMACLATAIGVLLAVRRQWIVLAGWVAAFAGGGLLQAALKFVMQRPRPPDAAEFLWRASWSFPSGHAMGSLIGYGMLAYVATIIWVHARPRQLLVISGAALLILAVGLSRLYLGVHYLSDVVAGYAAGAVWLSACISGLEFTRSPRNLP